MKKRWYVTAKERLTTIPTYKTTLYAGPVATKREAARFCAILRDFYRQLPYNQQPFPGPEVIGIEQLAEVTPGRWNKDLGLVVPDDVNKIAAATAKASRILTRRLRKIGDELGFETWEGSERACLALAKHRGVAVGQRIVTSPDQHGHRHIYYHFPDSRGLLLAPPRDPAKNAWGYPIPEALQMKNWRITFTPVHIWDSSPKKGYVTAFVDAAPGRASLSEFAREVGLAHLVEKKS